jgi:short-subunit dehydrogenase
MQNMKIKNKPETKLINKVCLVIGGNSDIAKEIAYKFAKDGYSIHLAGRSISEMERTAKDISNRFDVNSQVFSLDIEDNDSVNNFLNSYNQFPEIVIFAIGYLGNQKLAEESTVEANRIININFTYQIPIINYFANLMELQKSGNIIIISSVAGLRGRGTNYFYGASKSAMSAFASGLRQRLSLSNVFVMSVLPGFIITKMTQGIDAPKLFTGDVVKVAASIFSAFKRKKSVLITPFIYRILFLIINNLPEKLFIKLRK